MSPPDPAFGRLAKRCPHCGAREVTLGSSCTACGRPYEPQGLVDRAPSVGEDIPLAGPGGGLAFAVVALANLFLILITAIIQAPLMLARWMLRHLRGRREKAP